MRILEHGQALAEAGDLGRVCRPRELRTPEAFAPNAFYGNDRVLKLFAGLPVERPLKAVVPHGIVYNDGYVWEAERGAPLPAVLAYSEYRARAYERSTRLLPLRSAVPFAYLPKLLGEIPLDERTGTLFFPSHSSHRVTAEADFEGMAEAIARLDARYRPVTVCIYWRDYELGRHRPFVERGLRVVSAGHLFDPDFLFRFYHLCQSHRYAAGNRVGSSLLYAVLAGCRFFLLHDFDVAHSGAKEFREKDLSQGGDRLDALARAFADPVEAPTPQQSSLVAEICGLDRLLGRDELRDALAMADRLDRFGIARAPGSRRLHAAIPRAYPRAAWNLLRGAKRLIAS